MMYLISEERLKQFADIMRIKTGETQECSLEEIKNKLEAVKTEHDFLLERGCDWLFYNKKKITTIPQLDTSSVTNMESMFSKCSSLTTIPQLDTSSVTNMFFMFSGCTILTTIPQLDTSSVTNMAGMFNGCSSLTTIPQLDTRSVTDMNSTFNGCNSLATIPQLDTRSVTSMNSTFSGCSSLTTIPQLDTRSVTTMISTFSSCRSLTNCYLKNIKTALTIGSGTTYGHLLTADSLLYIIKELVNTGSNKTLTMGSANTAKLSSTYVKLIDITDEMRAEDDLIDSKLPFEVCESTDEGALAILTDYVALKNWSIK